MLYQGVFFCLCSTYYIFVFFVYRKEAQLLMCVSSFSVVWVSTSSNVNVFSGACKDRISRETIERREG